MIESIEEPEKIFWRPTKHPFLVSLALLFVSSCWLGNQYYCNTKRIVKIYLISTQK